MAQDLLVIVKFLMRVKMKKVFITGITGFLGSHLGKRLHAMGWEVSGNDNFHGSDRKI